jgi:hypothetical protein
LLIIATFHEFEFLNRPSNRFENGKITALVELAILEFQKLDPFFVLQNHLHDEVRNVKLSSMNRNVGILSGAAEESLIKLLVGLQA